MLYQWVRTQNADGFPVSLCCELVSVSTSAFYEWQQQQEAGPTAKQAVDAELVAVMREYHESEDGTVGEPRITPELRARGYCVNRKRVARLMRVNGIVGVHKPVKQRTTIPAGGEHPHVPDLIERGFDPGVPDVAWVEGVGIFV